MRKSEFATAAGSVTLTINGQTVKVPAKEFSTGSVGWYLSDKLTITLPNGKTLKAQLGVNLTVINSKDAKPGDDVCALSLVKKAKSTARAESVGADDCL